MKPFRFAASLLIGLVVLIVNWLMFTKGADALTAANNTMNWVGGIGIALMVIFDITLILYLLGKKLGWK